MSISQTPILREADAAKNEYRGFAMAQMRILKDYMTLAKLNTYSRVVTLANGVVITCQKSFNREDIFIFISVPSSVIPAESTATEITAFVYAPHTVDTLSPWSGFGADTYKLLSVNETCTLRTTSTTAEYGNMTWFGGNKSNSAVLSWFGPHSRYTADTVENVGASRVLAVTSNEGSYNTYSSYYPYIYKGGEVVATAPAMNWSTETDFMSEFASVLGCGIFDSKWLIIAAYTDYATYSLTPPYADGVPVTSAIHFHCLNMETLNGYQDTAPVTSNWVMADTFIDTSNVSVRELSAVLFSSDGSKFCCYYAGVPGEYATGAVAVDTAIDVALAVSVFFTACQSGLTSETATNNITPTVTTRNYIDYTSYANCNSVLTASSSADETVIACDYVLNELTLLTQSYAKTESVSKFGDSSPLMPAYSTGINLPDVYPNRGVVPYSYSWHGTRIFAWLEGGQYSNYVYVDYSASDSWRELQQSDYDAVALGEYTIDEYNSRKGIIDVDGVAVDVWHTRTSSDPIIPDYETAGLNVEIPTEPIYSDVTYNPGNYVYYPQIDGFENAEQHKSTSVTSQYKINGTILTAAQTISESEDIVATSGVKTAERVRNESTKSIVACDLRANVFVFFCGDYATAYNIEPSSYFTIRRSTATEKYTLLREGNEVLIASVKDSELTISNPYYYPRISLGTELQSTTYNAIPADFPFGGFLYSVAAGRETGTYITEAKENKYIKATAICHEKHIVDTQYYYPISVI